MICKCWNIGYKTIYDASFILTMWYVNYCIDKLKEIKERSFIWTMWYVNLLVGVSNEKLFYRFILTMWYVNSLRLQARVTELEVLY